MCRHVHRPVRRNALPNLTTIVPVTVYHEGSDVETYSRFILRLDKPTVCLDVISLVASSCGYNTGKIEHGIAH